MGNKGGKQKATASTPAPAIAQPKPSPLPPKNPEPSEADYKFLVEQTGLTRESIKSTFNQFMANNSDGKLDKQEFIRLYSSLRPEPPEYLDEISANIFKCFDTDRSGFLTFNEFMVAYTLTSRGDVRKKLDYAFNLYDTDLNGTLDTNEIRDVVTGMLDLLGADKKHNNPADLAKDIMSQLDSTHDGKVTKDEFINGLLKNFSLRQLLNPFD